jgi:GTPase SAR1 family protein
LTDAESFFGIKDGIWAETITEHCGPDIPKVYIATKSDEEIDRKVDTDLGLALARLNKAEFFETSAKTGKNILPPIYQLAESILPAILKLQASSCSEIKLSVEKLTKPKKNCWCW